ncbi:MAG: SpoIIE family protein phosphatase [Roseofilum sp. SBFL]|uniref:SpoIIE family protein phosphatase n=1 Tax=unclassified Roseofilum TaxID=2620099 RepID=UPI001B1F08BA|nr:MULTISPECIES: SpoIIE family protein phosphatase [unclassified Roseofilum]MBP0015734.1 SpoIIE family protein phosphatase [Roseofilum sp. SID3]MBP0023402.1 SpoIIE family protein phosphatase [Roseofilum sp. SID2]MBP0038127.1 SpoIIE family protein phosphatase [Roseofilum sp. SID1]MBP0044324.1 SpoIIE family protein phosphatase [Roseofilum sp. SBFL]
MKSFSSHSLRFQLTVLVLLAVIPGLLAISWLTSSMATAWMRQSAKQNREIRAQELVQQLATYSSKTEDILSNIAQVKDMVSMNPERQEPILRFLVATYGLTWAQTFDRQGKEVSSTWEKTGENVANRSWFQQARAGSTSMEAFISQAYNQPVLCSTVPIWGQMEASAAQSYANGVLRSCINLVTLSSQLRSLRWGKTGYAMLLDRQGYILVHPDVTLLSQPQFMSWENHPDIQPTLTSPGQHFERQDRDGNYWLGYSLPLGNGLILLLQEQTRELRQPEEQFWQISVYLTLGTLLVIGAAVWFIATSFTRPITDLIVVSTTLCTGELKQRIQVNREDEIGILVDSFNRMADQLQKGFRQLAQANQTLEDKVTRRTKELETANKALYAANTTLTFELEKGRQIQRNFLPKRDEAKPLVILNPPNWEVLAWFKPARQVAGDFYDAFELEEDYIGLVIADICDKGVGAALFMPLIQSLIRIFSGQTSLDGLVLTGKFTVGDAIPSTEHHNFYTADRINALKAVELTNHYLAKNHGNLGMFATLFFGILDRKTGNLVYINAGHLPLFILKSRGGVKESLPPTGPAVGIQMGADYKSHQVTLDPGDLLLGYTDGITDARSPQGKSFSLESLLSILEQPATSATVLLERIIHRIDSHRHQTDQFDDMTLLVVRRSVLPAPSENQEPSVASVSPH